MQFNVKYEEWRIMSKIEIHLSSSRERYSPKRIVKHSRKIYSGTPSSSIMCLDLNIDGSLILAAKYKITADKCCFLNRFSKRQSNMESLIRSLTVESSLRL